MGEYVVAVLYKALSQRDGALFFVCLPLIFIIVKQVLSGTYSIFTGTDIQNELNNFISKNYSQSTKIILVDENTSEYCLPFVDAIEHLKDAEVIEIESGEQNKNIETIIGIWGAMTDFGADRKSLLINLGGGVIGDLGGFAASTFKRGIDFINIPTTLLSQVDASVGGKTGIDFSTKKNVLLKNLIVVFNNPKAVFIFPDFLKTLNQREILSGFAEIVKHALIKDKDYFEIIKRVDLSEIQNSEEIIFRSIEIKSEIVMKDPKEKGLRRILNFGHTIGHAIESLSLKNDESPLLHGESVAIGMICEAYLSAKISGLKENELEEISLFIKSKFHSYKIDKGKYSELISIMKEDKKNESGKINFSLLSEIGNGVANQNCSEELISHSMDFYNNLP